MLGPSVEVDRTRKLSAGGTSEDCARTTLHARTRIMSKCFMQLDISMYTGSAARQNVDDGSGSRAISLSAQRLLTVGCSPNVQPQNASTTTARLRKPFIQVLLHKVVILQMRVDSTDSVNFGHLTRRKIERSKDLPSDLSTSSLRAILAGAGFVSLMDSSQLMQDVLDDTSASGRERGARLGIPSAPAECVLPHGPAWQRCTATILFAS